MERVHVGGLALVLAGVLGCKGDPTGDLRNGVDHLTATPSAIFLGPTGSNNVVIQAVDEQGNPETVRFTLGEVSPELDVVVDSAFNQVVDNNGTIGLPTKATRIRYIVTPTAGVGDAAFEVKADGHSIRIPVRLVPDSLTATFSSAAPALGDTVTLTTAAPFAFADTATVTVGGSDVILVSQTPTAIRFIPAPGSGAGPVTVNGVGLSYATTLSLSLPTQASFTAPAALAGTGALATAPALTIPATGASRVQFDAGATAAVPECINELDGHPCRVYKVTLAAGRTFDMSATWGGEQDLGLYFLTSGGALTTAPGFCDAAGDGSQGQPEACRITLGAGTFYLVVANFSDSDPAWLRVEFTGR
ncbi:MAG: hypothetical protein U0133_02635 [Gemmatimonadales bacterium]